jgi:putative tryptophan/tyrosine transport system substrate-binding protein
VIKRREFIALLGGAAMVWPRAARAQQAERMPVIGFLHPASKATYEDMLAAFSHGLKETGYIEGQNATIEYRWAEGQYDRLPAMAVELIDRPVAVLVAGAFPAALAAKASTSTTPIVFMSGADPVQAGLVASLNRPGGNMTGMSLLMVGLLAKRLELLHELVPKTESIGLLVNPNNPRIESDKTEMEAAARALGEQALIMMADNENEIDTAFVTLVQAKVGAVVVTGDPIFTSRRNQIVALAARHAIPAVYEWREFAGVGGLMSYGPSFADQYRQAGIYTGRILNGARPSDLPVVQPTKFDLVINLKAAKALGLTVPMIMQMTADEVIE